MVFSKSNPKSLIKAELHTHSTYSDGSYNPEILAEMCKSRGVKVWALTDHDTCSGCERASEASNKYGIEFIPGIEVSAHHGRSIHILGYNVDVEKIADYSEEQIRYRKVRMRTMVTNLKNLGIDIEFDDIVLPEHADVYTRPHIARALIKKGYGKSIQDVFDTYIGENCESYVASTWPSVEQAIEIIIAAKGTPVLAHPGIYDLDSEIPKWIRMGIKGIEAMHPRHDLIEENKYKTMAENHDIFWTQSSDYHGPQHIGEDEFGTIEILESQVPW